MRMLSSEPLSSHSRKITGLPKFWMADGKTFYTASMHLNGFGTCVALLCAATTAMVCHVLSGHITKKFL